NCQTYLAGGCVSLPRLADCVCTGAVANIVQRRSVGEEPYCGLHDSQHGVSRAVSERCAGPRGNPSDRFSFRGNRVLWWREFAEGWLGLFGLFDDGELEVCPRDSDKRVRLRIGRSGAEKGGP